MGAHLTFTSYNNDLNNDTKILILSRYKISNTFTCFWIFLIYLKYDKNNIISTCSNS